MLRPMCVPQDEDAMQMVWHHDVRVQIDMREESREGSPHGFDDSTDCSQPDPTSFYLSENTCSPEGTDCDEIPPSIAVIEPPQTNRAPDGQFAHAVPLRLVLSGAARRGRPRNEYGPPRLQGRRCLRPSWPPGRIRSGFDRPVPGSRPASPDSA